METIRAIAFILLLASCASDENTLFTNLIDARTFTVETPPGWKLMEDQGIDTYIGRIAGPKDTIFFDQGFLSFGSLDNIVKGNETIFFSRIEINGVPAIIHQKSSPDPSKKVLLSVYLDAGDGQQLNHLYAFDPRNEKLVTQVFLSHKFK